jgi:6,7-dimethyl-8-ribityllumazine synthase
MHPINIIEGDFTPLQDARFALVAARFNSFIVQNLINGAVDAYAPARCPGNQHRPDLDARFL